MREERAAMEKRLTDAQQAELRFLRQRVDREQDELLRVNRQLDINQRMFHARQDLQSFVERLRKEGYNI
jgi:hypothetical protein